MKKKRKVTLTVTPNVTCWPKVTITRFYGFDDNKTYMVFVLIKFKWLSLFQGSKDLRSFFLKRKVLKTQEDSNTRSKLSTLK